MRSHATASKFTRGEAAPTIVCPSKEIVIDSENPEDVNEQLAKEMKRCYSQWGRGTLDLFGRENGTYCHICSTVDINGVNEIKGLPQYLDTHKATKDLTYMEYFAGTKSGGYFTSTGLKDVGATVLPTDKPLGVIFYHAKGRTELEKLRDDLIGSPAQAATIGGTAGAAATGVALFGVGVVVGVTGVPLVIGGFAASTLMLAGISGGAAGGLWVSITQRTEFSAMSGVVIRPLDRSNIDALGCKYMPVANS
jgi:hypothetical protein